MAGEGLSSMLMKRWAAKLSPFELKLAAHIYTAIDAQGGRPVRLSARTLAASSGVSERTVERVRKSLADKGVIRLRMEAGRFWHGLPEGIREAYQRQSAPLPSETPATPVPPPAPASGAESKANTTGPARPAEAADSAAQKPAPASGAEARVPPAAPASVAEAPPQASAKRPDATTAPVTPPAAPPAELPIEVRLMQAMQRLVGEKVTPAHVRQAQQLLPDSEMALGCMDDMYEEQVKYLQHRRQLPNTYERVDQMLVQVCRDCADTYPRSPFRVKWDQRQAARKPKA